MTTTCPPFRCPFLCFSRVPTGIGYTYGRSMYLSCSWFYCKQHFLTNYLVFDLVRLLFIDDKLWPIKEAGGVTRESEHEGNGINKLDFLCLFGPFACLINKLLDFLFCTEKERIRFLDMKILSANCYIKISALPDSVPISNLFGCLLPS